MEAGSLIATMDGKKPGDSGPENPDKPENGTPKGASGDKAKETGKGPAPAPERKKPTKLSEDRRFKLFSGTANPKLAEAIGKHIGVPVGEAKLDRKSVG